MFETRLFKIRKIQQAPFMHSEDIYDVPNNPTLFSAVTTINAHNNVMGRIIRTLGPIEDGNEYFVPALAANRVVNGRFIPMPEQVTFSNLRGVVDALAEAETPVQYRNNFYMNNPLPGAIWSANVNNRILLNPRDFMPIDYDMDSFSDDVREYNRMNAFVQKKLPKFVEVERLNYSAKGNKSVFISSEQEGCRVRDRGQNERLADYYARIKLEGNIHAFWSNRLLTKTEQLEGQLILLGEIPVQINARYPIYENRGSRSGSVLGP